MTYISEHLPNSIIAHRVQNAQYVNLKRELPIPSNVSVGAAPAKYLCLQYSQCGAPEGWDTCFINHKLYF